MTRPCGSDSAMASIAKPIVVLAGPIHPDGHTLLETEARVTVCQDLTEDGVIAAARAAEGILFRIRPNCSERPSASLYGASIRSAGIVAISPPCYGMINIIL